MMDIRTEKTWIWCRKWLGPFEIMEQAVNERREALERSRRISAKQEPSATFENALEAVKNINLRVVK